METQNKLLCEGLASRGHDVVVIAPAPEKEDTATGYRKDGENLTYAFVDAPPGKYSPQWWKESTSIFQEMQSSNPFDVIISQSMAGQKVIRFLRAGGEGEKLSFKDRPQSLALGNSPPCVVIQHGTILGELKTRWKALWSNSKCEARSSKQAINSKFQTQEHLGFRNSDLFGASDLVFRVFNLVKQLLFFFLRLIPYGLKIYVQDQIRLRRADKIIAVSDLVRDSLLSEYFLPREKVEVVYNGIDVEKFQITNNKSQIKKDLRIEKEKVLLYVGRIEKEKGLEKLLRAVSNLKFKIENLKLIIVGDGEYLEELKVQAEKLGITDKVVFTGRVPYENVPSYYAAADVFVLPSLRQEGLPMTLPEAMASRLPVVASRIGGIPNAVKDKETGFLVEPGNVEELSERLFKVLKNDNLREQLGEKAINLAKQKFSRDSMVDSTLCVIRSIK